MQVIRWMLDASLSHRRSFLVSGAAAMVGAFLLPSDASAGPLGKLPDSVVQREINSFNDLINNFKDQTLNGGLNASKLKETSVSFIEFGEKMKKGEVTFVEFIAPGGDVAYATFKDDKGGAGERLRIGEGYPITSKNSWSSPGYVIRSVSNFGVPYKFTVPGLDKFNKRR